MFKGISVRENIVLSTNGVVTTAFTEEKDPYHISYTHRHTHLHPQIQ